MFRYSNDDYGNPGAYARHDAPSDPLTVASAPASLREELAKLTLPLRFAETDAFHLADFLADDACATYSDTTLHGKQRAPSQRRPSGGTQETRGNRRAMLVLAAFPLSLLVLLIVLLILLRR